MHTAKVNDDIGGITFNADGSRMFSQTGKISMK